MPTPPPKATLIFQPYAVYANSPAPIVFPSLKPLNSTSHPKTSHSPFKQKSRHKQARIFSSKPGFPVQSVPPPPPPAQKMTLSPNQSAANNTTRLHLTPISPTKSNQVLQKIGIPSPSFSFLNLHRDRSRIRGPKEKVMMNRNLVWLLLNRPDISSHPA